MFKLSEFGNRLDELMQDREINAPALAIRINTDRTNITRYLRGERTPTFTTFVNLINFLNCSADYLLGLDEIPKDNKTFMPIKPFDKRLRELLTNGKSQYGLMKEKKISSSILHDWLSGKRLPSIENLCKIAEYVECSVDFLLGREDIKPRRANALRGFFIFITTAIQNFGDASKTRRARLFAGSVLKRT